MTNTNLPPGFGIHLLPAEFEARWVAFHKQLFASTEGCVVAGQGSVAPAIR